MEIKFQHNYQFTIADLLWNATDEKAVKLILKAFGVEGEVVYNMLVAHYLDEVMDTNLAEKVIARVQ